MKVLYDYQIFFSQNYGGISKCFAELISNLPKNAESVVGIKQSNNVYLKELDIVSGLQPLHWTSDNFILPFYSKIQKKLLDWSNLIPCLNTPYTINKKYSIELLQKGNFDIFHPTDLEDYYLRYLKGKPFVFTIHDMIPEILGHNPNSFQCRQKRLLASKAAHIIAVSENTKKDIIRLLNIPDEKISVVYHAAKIFSFKNEDVIQKETNLPAKYFLYVGNRNNYKSFNDFLIQTSSFFQKNKDVNLICSGAPFNKGEKALIEKLKLSLQVNSCFFSTEQLMYAYSKAIAFVFPSRYEGFGIPILEAFAMKCPVLLNNASCFPEIAKDAALYFNLDDNYSCLKTVETVCNLSHGERELLVKKGFERFNDFSWKRSAKQLVDVYESVI